MLRSNRDQSLKNVNSDIISMLQFFFLQNKSFSQKRRGKKKTNPWLFEATETLSLRRDNNAPVCSCYIRCVNIHLIFIYLTEF